MTEDLPLGYLPCRSLLHAWDIVSFSKATDEDLARVKTARIGYTQVIVRVTQCNRCFAGRIEFFGRTNRRSLEPFTKFANRYLYPKDYLFHGEGPRPSRAEYTTALFERFYQGKEDG